MCTLPLDSKCEESREHERWFVAAPCEIGGGREKLFTLSPFSPFSRDTHTGLTFLGTNECLGRLTCSGTNRKGLGPKVLVGVRAVSRVGGWNTEVGMSESRGAPARGEGGVKEWGRRGREWSVGRGRGVIKRSGDEW